MLHVPFLFGSNAQFHKHYESQPIQYKTIATQHLNSDTTLIRKKLGRLSWQCMSFPSYAKWCFKFVIFSSLTIRNTWFFNFFWHSNCRTNKIHDTKSYLVIQYDSLTLPYFCKKWLYSLTFSCYLAQI